MNNYDEIG